MTHTLNHTVYIYINKIYPNLDVFKEDLQRSIGLF